MSASPGSDISHHPQPFVTQGSSEKTPIGRTPGETKDHLQSQLGAVENLQYQLTSQELQFAQRMALKEQQAAEHVKITVASTSSDSNDGESRFLHRYSVILKGCSLYFCRCTLLSIVHHIWKRIRVRVLLSTMLKAGYKAEVWPGINPILSSSVVEHPE